MENLEFWLLKVIYICAHAMWGMTVEYQPTIASHSQIPNFFHLYPNN